MNRLALLLAAALPLAGATPLPAGAVQPPDAAPASTSAPAPAPPGKGEALRLGNVAVDVGAWLVWSGFATFGGLDSNELPRAAVPPSTEQTLGMTVRQSRFSVALGLPSDGLLAGASLTGLLELDLMGGAAGGDQALPLVRLRHAWAAARWKALADLSVLVGQSWGLLGGPHGPESLAHLAVPRFSGAGYLYRRAPQLRVSAETGGELAVQAQAALLAPIDRATSPAATAASPDRPPPTSVGERSGLPDVEARVALRWSPGGARRLEVGLSGHAGRETWTLAGAGGDVDADVDSYAGALDARLDLAWLTLLGGAFYGKNLDIQNTLSAGVTTSLNAAGDPVAVTGVQVQGGWAQLQVRPLEWLTLLAGAGLEAAAREDLPPNPPSATAPLQALQVSGGALVALTGRWQAGLEYTAYRTTYVGAPDRQLTSTQVELATRYVF